MAATLATVMARSAQLTVGEILRDQTFLQPDAEDFRASWFDLGEVFLRNTDVTLNFVK